MPKTDKQIERENTKVERDLFRRGLIDSKGFSKETDEEFRKRRAHERAESRKKKRQEAARERAKRTRKADVMTESKGSTAYKLRQSRKMGGAKTILDLIR